MRDVEDAMKAAFGDVYGADVTLNPKP